MGLNFFFYNPVLVCDSIATSAKEYMIENIDMLKDPKIIFRVTKPRLPLSVECLFISVRIEESINEFE